MPKNAQDYISAFTRGEDFTPPAAGVISEGRPDPKALELLGRELAVTDGTVREKIVALLVDIGRRTDPLTAKGADVLRDPRIIALLAGPGLAKVDVGRDAAMDALRKLVVQRDLALHGDSIAEALDRSPSEEAFLLIAKAKPQQAKVIVERLAAQPQWKNVESTRIARAALGNVLIEEEFLATVNAAVDGKELARALGPLALMGTTRSLKAIAERLRTSLIIDVPGAYRKSVRLNVLDALLYNFPDQPTLYPNNINSDVDYAAAESFCINRFGVRYADPRPPFMTYFGYPMPSN